MSALAVAPELPVCSYRIKGGREAEAGRAGDAAAGGELSLPALAMLTCAAEPAGCERNPQPPAPACLPAWAQSQALPWITEI